MTTERWCSTLEHEHTPAKKSPLAPALEFLRRNARMCIVALVFFLAVITIVFVALAGGNPLYRLRQIFGGRDYGTIRFDDHTSNGYAAFDDGLAVGTISGLFTYDLQNQETNLAQNAMSVPQLRTGGGTVLACDIGGSAVCAIDAEAGTVLNERLDGTLLDGDVSDGGALCYAVSTSGTKTLLTVLDPEHHEIYHWYSETAFFNQCAVSQTGSHLVGISLGQQNGAFDSTAVIFSTTQEEPLASLSLGSDYFLDLDFTGSNSLCAIGESGTRCFTLGGELLGSYDYSDTYLTHYDTGGDGFIALATNKNRAGGQFQLTTLDTSGKELASIQISAQILDISAAGNYLAVLSTDGLVIYNARLKVCAQTADTNSAKQVAARSNGTALLIGSGEATLFIG